MKFITTSKHLLKSLQQVGGVVASNSGLASLEGFLFELKGSALHITATDLETMMHVQMEVSEASGNGAICIPAKILLEHLKGLPELPIAFAIDIKDLSAQMVTDLGKYKIGCESADDFPKAPEADDATSFTMPAAALVDSINKTLFAVSSDTLRPAMTGVYFQLATDSLTFVATNVHSLAKFTRTDVVPPQADGFIVPKKPLQQLKSALPDDETPVELAYNASHLFVQIGKLNLSCRLIDARFPDYVAVIPTGTPFLLTVSRGDFLSALRRVAVFSNRTTNQVVLDVKSKMLSLAAQDVDFSCEGKETMPCDYKGDDMKIAFNARLLAEIVNNIDGAEIHIELRTPTRAAIIKPASMGEGEEELILLMPLMVGA